MADLITIRYPTRGARALVNEQARGLPNGFRRALDARTKIHKEELIAATPVGETKRLKRSWRIRKDPSAGGGSRNIIYNTQPYLGLVLRGRDAIPKPGAPPRTKPLVFRVRGQLVFAMSVKGVRPNPFHKRAAARARARARGLEREVLIDTLRV